MNNIHPIFAQALRPYTPASPSIAATDAMLAIKRDDLTPEVIAQLLVVLALQIKRAPWSCTTEAEFAAASLEYMADLLRGEA